ncbi:MAG: Extracellular exo-alpha-L-arabinofuranosidase precursor [Bacteroidetes bacterium]|nr:Extracellular exo-alpha-L-arabinofuranosidase precursor [Bacteroidota bacterium]
MEVRSRIEEVLARFVLLIVLWSCSAISQTNPAASLMIHADKPGPQISPTLYGIFFEEINCAGDGGLYAELIRNRSFEESSTPVHWKMIKEGMVDAQMSVDSMYSVSEKNEHYLKMKVILALEGYVGVANSGYWGIPVIKGASYDLSLNAMALDGINGSLVAVLESPDEQVIASDTLKGVVSEWRRITATLVARESSPAARLVIRILEPGHVFLDDISLFPKETFKNRPNGLRPDLATMLSGMQPSFVRFPGGCWVEGDNLRLSYRWKQTIGDIAERRYQENIWQYFSTNGLGFHEYLQMCEDLGAEPLFVINCGMSHRETVPLYEMRPWVQDALDALEYANGSVDTRWGSLRAKNGHPAPFRMKYMEIGNENGGEAYAERYALFHDAIKARYPNVHLIANVWGGYPKNRPIELIDEHYYSSPKFFIDNANRYDSYDRKGPKVYVGEYAVTEGCGNGNLRAALAEAAFMTGMERNSDVVTMASYAPLFANVNYKKWNPDLINFNGSIAYGTPSYYVQQLFSRTRGDVVLRSDLQVQDLPPEPPSARNGKIGVGTWNTQAEFKDITVTKDGKALYASDFESGAKGWNPLSGEWKLAEGALRQSRQGSNRRTVAGDTSWLDYTYTLKARKLGGAEGFLILFSVKDDNNWVWWNIGGWGNTQHALEYSEGDGKSILGKSMPGTVESGRWYDVKIELSRQRIKCFLDGQLIHDATYDLTPLKPLHAVVSRTSASGEIIVKVVNVSKQAIDTRITIDGVASVEPNGEASVLMSADPRDENTIAEPLKIVPRTTPMEGIAKEFQHTFAPNSVTIMRLKGSQ